MRVCVCARERGRERERERECGLNAEEDCGFWRRNEKSKCVCVCVRERERVCMCEGGRRPRESAIEMRTRILILFTLHEGIMCGGVENKNTHNTQINLNQQKLGEP